MHDVHNDAPKHAHVDGGVGNDGRVVKVAAVERGALAEGRAGPSDQHLGPFGHRILHAPVDGLDRLGGDDGAHRGGRVQAAPHLEWGEEWGMRNGQ